MPENATFYASDPSMIGSRLFDRIPSIKSYESISSENEATGFILKTDWGQVKINIMPGDQITRHLDGLEGYIRNQTQSEDDLIYILSRLHYVQICLGCVITHEQNDEDDVHSFLFEFNSALNSLMFLYDSLWDWSGEPLCGPHKQG